MTELNTPKFQKFKAKREQWIEWLSGDDRHSVMKQIRQMIWDAAVFRVINEARRLAPEAQEGGVQLNGITHGLINKGFFDSQSNAIRRLIDTSSVTGRLGVYSLHGLLEDMEKNAHLMTRENILAAEGLAYDYEPIREACLQYGLEQSKAGKGAWFTPSHLAWHKPEERHKVIDRLSGVEEARRTPVDSVHPKCFIRLKEKLDVCNQVKTYVDKFVAHAATPGSRATADADNLTITLKHLWDAHESIYKVATFVSIYLLGGSGLGGLATPQFDQFKYMDRPLVETERLPCLDKVWKDYDRETHDWGLWGFDEFEAEAK